jgi:hypothetical protein
MFQTNLAISKRLGNGLKDGAWSMNTMIEVPERWVEEKVSSHFLPEGSAFISRGFTNGVIVAHLVIEGSLSVRGSTSGY